MKGKWNFREFFAERASSLSFPAINALKVNQRSRKSLDYASDSDPEEECTTETESHTFDLNNSDCESIDSDLEDPLK